MSEADKPDGKRWGRQELVALLAAAFVGYFLLSVPLWLFARATGAHWLLVVNRPHDWLGEHLTIYQGLLDCYLRLWGIDPGRRWELFGRSL